MVLCGGLTPKKAAVRRGYLQLIPGSLLPFWFPESHQLCAFSRAIMVKVIAIRQDLGGLFQGIANQMSTVQQKGTVIGMLPISAPANRQNQSIIFFRHAEIFLPDPPRLVVWQRNVLRNR